MVYIMVILPPTHPQSRVPNFGPGNVNFQAICFPSGCCSHNLKKNIEIVGKSW